MTQQLQQIIDAAWENRGQLSSTSAPQEVLDAVEHLDTFWFAWVAFQPDTDLVAATLAGERASYRLNKRYVRKDGEVLWGDLSVALLRDGLASGQVEGLDALARLSARDELGALLHDPEMQRPARLAWLLRHFNHDIDLALAAYNAGEGSVRRHGNQIPPFAETQAYVRSVRRYEAQWLRKLRAE